MMVFKSFSQQLSRIWRKFCCNSQGNMTIVLALTAIPVILAGGAAIDYARISRVHDKLQDITDGAAIAAASARNLTGTSDQKKTQRVAIATNFVNRGLLSISDAEAIGLSQVTAT